MEGGKGGATGHYVRFIAFPAFGARAHTGIIWHFLAPFIAKSVILLIKVSNRDVAKVRLWCIDLLRS